MTVLREDKNKEKVETSLSLFYDNIFYLIQNSKYYFKIKIMTFCLTGRPPMVDDGSSGIYDCSSEVTVMMDNGKCCNS